MYIVMFDKERKLVVVLVLGKWYGEDIKMIDLLIVFFVKI